MVELDRDDVFRSAPADLAAAHAMILAQREMLAEARSEAKVRALEIERLKLMLAKARREKFGQSSERGKQLIEQLELAIADLEEAQAEEEAKAEIAAPEKQREKRERTGIKPARRPLPSNLPRERIVYPPPCVCGKCGGVNLRKLGEAVTESLECEPRRWKVVEHVREKFSCRDCEGITEPPAPSHPIARGRAGPSLLAMILASKFLLHQPLNRQSETYAREGVEIDVSTLAGWVGASVATLDPILDAIRAHVFAAERLHVDDTTVPVLAKLKTVTGRIWTYVRDDRPFGGKFRRRRFSTIHEHEPANIRALISPDGPASCRPTLSPGSTSSTRADESQLPLSRRRVGPTGDENFSIWRN